MTTKGKAMAKKRTFEDWMGDLREQVRDAYCVDLEELEGFDEDDARSLFREGYTVRSYVRDLEPREREEDVSEIMREL